MHEEGVIVYYGMDLGSDDKSIYYLYDPNIDKYEQISEAEYNYYVEMNNDQRRSEFRA